LPVANLCLLLKLCCLHRTSFHCRIVFSCSESVFAAELWCLQWINFLCRRVLSVVNQCSLLNFYCLPQISFCYRIVFVCSESVFAAELCCHRRISFRCWIVESVANPFSLSNCGVTSKLVSLAILHSRESICWQICVTSEPISTNKFL
jgi:hypothetical protein